MLIDQKKKKILGLLVLVPVSEWGAVRGAGRWKWKGEGSWGGNIGSMQVQEQQGKQLEKKKMHALNLAQ